MAVDWERLDPVMFERMVCVLLSRERPGVRRIDGAGGDGGVDALFREPDGVHVFDVKSYSDRIDVRRNRRAAVERGLARAAGLGPASWSLVAPVDLTRDEDRWFEGLRDRVGFPLLFLGRQWLDDRLADHPQVRAYYVEDERDTVMRLLAEHNALGAAASSVPEVLARTGSLAERLDALDPHLRFVASTGAMEEVLREHPGAVMLSEVRTALGPVVVAVVPRYPGAEDDSGLLPLRVALRAPDGPAGDAAREVWDAMVRWGEPAVLEHPYVEVLDAPRPGGLGPSPGPSRLEFRAAASEGVTGGRLTARRGGRAVASVPVSVDVSSGSDGISFRGRDRTGAIGFDGRLGPPDVVIHLRAAVPPGRLPAELLPALRLHHEAATGAELALEIDIDGSPGPEIGFGRAAAGPRAGEELLAFAEGLDLLQREAGRSFPVPVAPDDALRARVRRLAAVVRDGVLDEPAPDEVLLPGPPDGLAPDGWLHMEITGPVDVAGEPLDLGDLLVTSGPWRAGEGPDGGTLLVPAPGARTRTALRPPGAGSA